MNLKKLIYRSYSSTGRANPWKEQNYADFFQGLTKVQVLLRPQKTSDKEARTANTGLAKVAVQCSADTFVVNQSLVLRINICGENRHLRQARKR
jgi:hypothetical protein